MGAVKPRPSRLSLGSVVLLALVLCVGGERELWAGRSAATSSAAAKAGWESIQRGAYLDANEAFTHAAQLAPDDASIQVGLGFSYQLLADYERARTTLERAIHLDMTVELAHGLLGDLYARRGELERALHHYKFAVEQDPENPGLQRRLYMAQRDYQAELGFDRIYSAHFLVKYREAATQSELAHDVVDRLELVYTQVGSEFDYFPSDSITVILYPDRELWEATETPLWAGGLFDGTIHLPAPNPGVDEGVSDSSLRHEYTHALVDQMSAGRAPVWLSEGLALYIEGRPESSQSSVPGQDASSLVLPGAVNGELLGLSPEAARVAYAHSYRATRKLIDHYGLEGVRTLLKALSGTSDFPTAFDATFHTPFREFEVGRSAHPAGQSF